MKYNLVIRPVRPEDAEDINAIRRQREVAEFTLALPSERIEASRGLLAGLGPNDHLMVAEVEGRVVGMAGLHVFEGRRRHSAGMGISVHRDFQGAGIGRALLETLLDIADNFLVLRRLELEAWPDNTRAIALYESLGFEREGIKRQYAIRGGGYVDAIIMARLRPEKIDPAGSPGSE